MSHPFKDCPACPVEVRDLFAVAHNIIVRTPGIAEGDLKRAVENMQPIIDRHFADVEHSHPRAYQSPVTSAADAKDATVPDHSEREAANAGGLWTVTRLHDLGSIKDARGEVIAQTYYRDAKVLTDAHNAAIASHSPSTIAAGQEAANAKDAARMAFLHSPNKDAEGYEYGIAKVRFTPDGRVETFSWALSDSTDLDAAMAAAPSSEKGGA